MSILNKKDRNHRIKIDLAILKSRIKYPFLTKEFYSRKKAIKSISLKGLNEPELGVGRPRVISGDHWKKGL